MGLAIGPAPQPSDLPIVLSAPLLPEVQHRGQIAVLTVEKAEEREGRLKAEALAAELAAENAAQAAPARRRAALPDAPDRLATTHICAFRRGGVTRKTPPDPTSMSQQINGLG